jgi:hypothetical protein
MHISTYSVQQYQLTASDISKNWVIIRLNISDFYPSILVDQNNNTIDTKLPIDRYYELNRTIIETSNSPCGMNLEDTGTNSLCIFSKNRVRFNLIRLSNHHFCKKFNSRIYLVFYYN